MIIFTFTRHALAAVFLALMLPPSPLFAAEKATIAIRLPSVGDGVPEDSQRKLDREKILSDLEAAVSATRKFRLVSRDKAKLQVIRDEQEFSASDLSSGGAAATGELKAANYLIIPTVSKFAFYRSSQKVPNISGKFRQRDVGELVLTIQALDTSTGEVMRTFQLPASYGSSWRISNSAGGSPGQGHFAKLSEEVAEKLGNQIVEAVFPMRVIKVSAGRVWLNRGAGSGLEQGLELNVYRPGEDLVDPDTGESLGPAESKIGKIKVTKINDKHSVADIVTSSEAEPIEKLDIARKAGE